MQQPIDRSSHGHAPPAAPRVFCQGGYIAKARDVSEAAERRVYASYGITSHYAGQYEIDHLVPLELALGPRALEAVAGGGQAIGPDAALDLLGAGPLIC